MQLSFSTSADLVHIMTVIDSIINCIHELAGQNMTSRCDLRKSNVTECNNIPALTSKAVDAYISNGSHAMNH